MKAVSPECAQAGHCCVLTVCFVLLEVKVMLECMSLIIVVAIAPFQ